MQGKFQKLSKILFFKNRPLAMQLFALFAVLVIVPMLAVGLISYRQSSNILKEEAANYNLEVLEQVKAHIEYYIRDLEITTIKLLNHPDMIGFFENVARADTPPPNALDHVERLLSSAAFSRPDIVNIALYIDGIKKIETARTYPPFSADISQEYWFGSVPSSGEPIFVSRNLQWADREQRVLSIVKRIHSPRTLEPIGFLVMDLDFRRLQEIALIFDATGRFFYIIADDGHYIYHPVRAAIGELADEKMITTSKKTEMDLLSSEDKQRGFFTASRAHQLNWTLMVSVPYERITEGSTDLGKSILITTLFTLVFAYLLGLLYLTTVLRPIRALRDFMQRVETGDLHGEVPVESMDEIGSLSLGFNKMVQRLDALLEEVYISQLRETQALLERREIEMKVLQAQVNPHFIGNSLETIRGMALDKGNEDIAAMSSWLGLLLSYNLRHVASLVEMQEEVKYLDFYLKIQKCRFGDIFHVEYDVPDWAWQEKIVKFSLQPLVENCFVHGGKGKKDKLAIRIAIVAEAQNAFVLEVGDSGQGMRPEQLVELQVALSDSSSDGGGHIGIVNVHRRIVNQFGEGYGIKITSSLGCGTMVHMRLPRN
jgi:two-component system, sensor histidine kinase YesM